MKRDQANKKDCEIVLQAISDRLDVILREKGWGKFVSPYETVGVLRGNFKMVEDVVYTNVNDHQELGGELVDMAVAAIFGVVSLRVRKEQT